MLDITRPLDLIYNFVDKRVYYPRPNSGLRACYCGSNEKVLIHISNFRPVKRVEDVLDTYVRVNEEVPCHLLLVGEGPDLPKIQARVWELGLAGHVHFLGKQTDVAQIISLADVMLLPSAKESFGLVALEAMACGVPTVGTRVGGIPELVESGKTGFLTPLGDTVQMAAAVLKLLRDEPLYARFRTACLERAHTVFSDERITTEYEQIYYRVLAE
jgi:N-acetyl-alpha-D-glucosaminyl L-malate synthase BshA